MRGRGDNKGNEVFRTTVRVQGFASKKNNYNPRNRQATYGDTPTGTYKIIGWSDILSKKNRKVYGPNDALILKYESGEAVGKRSSIELHGGRQEVYNSKTGKWERKKNAHLWNTGGCIRIMDDDIAEMKKISQNLEAKDKTEKPEDLTVANDLIKKGNKYELGKNQNKYDIYSTPWQVTVNQWLKENPSIKVFIQ